MSRRRTNIAVGCCLFVAVLIAAVWVRGMFVRDQFTTYVSGRKCIAAVYPHHVYVIAYGAPASSVQTTFQTGLSQYPSRPIYWELRYHHRRGGTFRLGIPFWLPLAFAMAPPLWWVVQRVQARLRYGSGLCQTCGYDLRASRDRCPECGTPIPGEPGRTIADVEARVSERMVSRDKAAWQITLK